MESGIPSPSVSPPCAWPTTVAPFYVVLLNCCPLFVAALCPDCCGVFPAHPTSRNSLFLRASVIVIQLKQLSLKQDVVFYL